MIDYLGFLDYGILGIVIGWFMFRMEKVINNNTTVLYSVKEIIHKRVK